MSDLASRLVEEEEGCGLEAYRDTRGLWTIGCGHLLPDQSHDYTGYTWTQAQSDTQREIDMHHARFIAPQFPHFAEMNDVRQAVCTSMAFQLGGKPLRWPNFMAALSARDYISAGIAGRDSDWWRTQTPRRAEREIKMLISGEWVQHV